MVERKLSYQKEIEGRYRKNGVVVFIMDSAGKMLVLQETGIHDTDGGRAGDLSTFCETAMEGEEWFHTLIRGLREELGVTTQQERLFLVDKERSFLGEGLFSSDVLARVAVLYWFGKLDETLSFRGDGEVRVVGWVYPEQLLRCKLRPGVRKILEECLGERLLERTESHLPGSMLPLTPENLKIAASTLGKVKSGTHGFLGKAGG